MKHGQAPCYHILTLKVLKPTIKVIFIYHLYSNIKQPNFKSCIFLGNKATENRKSPGEDQIHAEFLKHAGKEARTSK